jgi:uncharacterized protein YqgC (DUF456 family)
VLYAGLVLAAWAEGFAYVGWKTLTLLALMAAGTYVLDILATMLGADRFGATWRGITGALAGAVMGLLWVPFGLIIGPFLGAVIGELTARRTLREASSAGLGAMIGFVVGVACKIGVAMMMIGLFLAVRVWGLL